MKIKNNIILSFLLIMMANLSMGQASDKKPQTIGIVSLVIGEAYVVSIKGETRQLQKESALFVGDQIETHSNGHVHIKFIDDGYVSLRPQSLLKIESYHYNPKDPEKSEIRFYLQQGVLRSISGKATEADHSIYRMNTPIAALGVLGTDYVIKTDLTQTWAAVYSGSIALAPFSHSCGSASLGVCDNATQLTADMANKYLEVSIGDSKSKIKIQLNTQGNNSDSREENPSSKDNINDSVVNNDTIDKDLASNEKIGTTVPNKKHLPKSTLSWVRWPWQPAHPDDKTALAVKNNKKQQKITIANSYAGLFRRSGTLKKLQPQTGKYRFGLESSHIVFIKKGNTWHDSSAATLNKSSLQMDFAKRTFSTHLEMSNNQSENATLKAQGRISDKGIYTSQTKTGKVAGTLSLDGNHTGMLFEKNLPSGVFKGITEWRQR